MVGMKLRFGRAWARATVALLLLGGCAEATRNVPTIVSDPKHRIGYTHWEVVQLPGQTVPIASIMDSTDKILLSLGCTKGTFLVLGPLKEGQYLNHPSIELAWDGSLETERLLRWFPSDGWGFGTVAGEPGFTPAIAHLKQHETLEATITAADGTVLRYRFALAEADNAIDYVISACGQKSA
jgi:hypothetical protein